MSMKSMKRDSNIPSRMKVSQSLCSSTSVTSDRARARRGIMIRAGSIRESKTIATWGR
jgi:hypothetical protein